MRSFLMSCLAVVVIAVGGVVVLKDRKSVV